MIKTENRQASLLGAQPTAKSVGQPDSGTGSSASPPLIIRACAFCGGATWCHHAPECPPVIDDEGNVHPVSQPCKAVCPRCLEYPVDKRHIVPSEVHARVSVLKPKETKVVIKPPAVGFQCENPKHRRPVRNRKGKIVGYNGKVHFSHKWEVCPKCDNRITDEQGTRVIYLPWPPFWTEESYWLIYPDRKMVFKGTFYETPCPRCGGRGKIW